MPTDEEVAAANAAKAASDKVAQDAANASAAEATRVKAAADAAAEQARNEQTVPSSRFQSVIAQKAESDRAKAALERELKLANDTLEEFRALGTKKNETAETVTTKAQTKALSPEELQKLVQDEAGRQAFDARCNASVAEGRKAHEDFDKIVLGDLTSISPISGANGRPVLPVPLVEAALETGNAHEVLYALGKDASEASRIMALRPTAQAVALAKFADKLAALAKTEDEPELDEDGKPKLPNVSRAPAPIKVPSKGGSHKPAFTLEDTENFSTEEWIRHREKQVREKRAAH